MEVETSGYVPKDIKATSKEIEVVKNLETMVRTWHEKADEMWGKESFHNWKHIEAVSGAKDKYLQSYHEKGVDPLRLFGKDGELDRWNQNPDNKSITEDEFETILDMAILMHDLGNIMESVSVNESGEMIPKFHKNKDGKFTYKAKDAEDRTKNIIKTIAFSIGIDDKHIPLMQELVEQTKFAPKDEEKDKPFAVFIRVVDQIGINYFSEDRDRMNGLVNENEAEDRGKAYNADFFINFSTQRLEQLVVNETTRERLVKDSWELDLLPVYEGITKNPVTANELKNIMKEIEFPS